MTTRIALLALLMPAVAFSATPCPGDATPMHAAVATHAGAAKVPASGQDADEAAVRIPLQAYLDGHATGESRHFERAFAADAWLMGLRDGKYRQWPARDYIAVSSSGRVPADEAQRRRTIRQVTVTGDVATAVIELDYPDMKALDHMSLLKRDGEWRIVAKVYDAMTPAASP